MLVAVAAPQPGAPEAPPDAERPPVIVVAGSRLDPRARREQREKLVQDYQTYRQLEVQKDDLRASHLLIFLMVTLLILLASSWMGLYLARRVTVPIQALAEGTRRISGGDLAHRVDVEADDELGVLVDSFNRMTEELESNKELLERSNRELVEQPAAGRRAGADRGGAGERGGRRGLDRLEGGSSPATARRSTCCASGRRWWAARSRRPGRTPSAQLAAVREEGADGRRHGDPPAWAASGRRSRPR